MLGRIMSRVARMRESAITFEPARRARAKSQRVKADSFEPGTPPALSPFPPPKLRGMRAANDALTLPLLQAGRYGAVIRALQGASPTTNELNNLGCAWAALASTQPRPDYWERAIAALEQSRDQAQTKSDRQRAAENVDLIMRVR